MEKRAKHYWSNLNWDMRGAPQHALALVCLSLQDGVQPPPSSAGGISTLMLSTPKTLFSRSYFYLLQPFGLGTGKT